MLLRRGLLIAPTLVVDSDPERTAGLADAGDVRVVVRDVRSGQREARSFPARQAVAVLGVLPDRRAPRTTAASGLLGRAAVAA
jgi:hypothetical protein